MKFDFFFFLGPVICSSQTLCVFYECCICCVSCFTADVDVKMVLTSGENPNVQICWLRHSEWPSYNQSLVMLLWRNGNHTLPESTWRAHMKKTLHWTTSQWLTDYVNITVLLCFLNMFYMVHSQRDQMFSSFSLNPSCSTNSASHLVDCSPVRCEGGWCWYSVSQSMIHSLTPCCQAAERLCAWRVCPCAHLTLKWTTVNEASIRTIYPKCW